MFEPNTVFVIGAGASKEAGLPLGFELAKTLSQSLNLTWDFRELKSGDRRIAYEFQRTAQHNCVGFDTGVLQDAARSVARGVRDAESIDNYVELHSDKPAVQAIAKLAISISIAQAEKNSSLFSYSRNSHSWSISESPATDRPLPRETWYQKFFEIAKDGVKATEIEKLFSEVSIVCFNYDRTIELFLFERIKSLYAVDDETAKKAVGNLRVYRPYGSLGDLRLTPRDSGGLKFGDLDESTNFWEVSKNIRTYSELPDSEVQIEIRRVMNEADTIIFLGFGFHKQNMDIIKRNTKKSIDAFATSYGMSDANKTAISRRITGSFQGALRNPAMWRSSGSPFLENSQCGSFMAEHKELFKG